MDLDTVNFENLIFAKFYDDNVPALPWPKMQRLLLMFRLMFRMPLVVIQEDYVTEDRLANEHCKGKLRTASRLANEIKKVTEENDAMYAPPIFLGRNELETDRIRRLLDRHHEVAKELFFVYGDNLRFIESIKERLTSQIGLILFKGTGLLVDTALKISKGEEIEPSAFEKGRFLIQLFVLW